MLKLSKEEIKVLYGMLGIFNWYEMNAILIRAFPNIQESEMQAYGKHYASIMNKLIRELEG